MRLWRKSKFSRILELVEKMSKEVSNFKSVLADLEDMKELEEEVAEKENKLIATLEAENHLLRERLHQKDIFVENLLAQLLGGANIKNLMGMPKEEPKPLVTPAVQRYIDRKKEYENAKANGKAPLP